MLTSFSGVELHIEADSPKQAYELMCELLGKRPDSVDWRTENSLYKTDTGEGGAVSELWERGEG